MAKPTSFTFPVYSFRKIETPFEKEVGYRNYLAIVNVKDLPDLTQWREINVRDPKTRGHVPQKIQSSLLEDSTLFVFKNRGLVLSASAVSFDNRKSTATIQFKNRALHGLLDGGHTYKVITTNERNLDFDQYIRLEILEGFDDVEDPEIVGIVEARNTSNQVKDESIMNLEKRFDGIKKALEGLPYADLIAYKEHELLDDEGTKPIDVREIISFMMALDKDNFDATSHPINAYRSKVACLKHFAKHEASFKKLYGILPEILALWDHIHLRIPALYNDSRKESGVAGGRFGRLTGVHKFDTKKVQLYFLQEKSEYSIPTGFKYPILGAFRAFLESRRNKYTWGGKLNPIEELKGDLGLNLANTVGHFALEAKNPSKTGKQGLVWQSCYQSAELRYLRAKHS